MSPGLDDPKYSYNAEPLSGPTADQLFERYEANEIDADQAFKGRRVMISGEIDSIGKEILGRPYVTFKVARSRLSSVQAVFVNENDLRTMHRGEFVTAICTVDGKTLGNVLASRCVAR